MHRLMYCGVGGRVVDTELTSMFMSPDKQTWGLRFDDRLSPETPRLLRYVPSPLLQVLHSHIAAPQLPPANNLKLPFL